MTAPPPHAAPALDRFRAAVLADAQIQQRLAEQQDAAAFTRIATEWASGRGIAITAHDLRARPNPLGVLGSGRPPHTGTDWPPAQWLPVRAAYDDPGVDWCHFAGERLAEPFYADTCGACPTASSSTCRAAARRWSRGCSPRCPNISSSPKPSRSTASSSCRCSARA
jgi:hypothetical protein